MDADQDLTIGYSPPITALRIDLSNRETLIDGEGASFRLFQDRYLFCAAKPIYAMALAATVSPSAWADLTVCLPVTSDAGGPVLTLTLADVLGHRLPLRKPNLWEYMVTSPSDRPIAIYNGLRRAERFMRRSPDHPAEYSEVQFGWIVSQIVSESLGEQFEDIVEAAVSDLSAPSSGMDFKPSRRLLRRSMDEFVNPSALTADGRLVPIMYASCERSRLTTSIPYGPFGSVAHLVQCYRGFLRHATDPTRPTTGLADLLSVLRDSSGSSTPFVAGFTNFGHIHESLHGVFGQLAAGGAFAAGIDLSSMVAWGYVSDVFVPNEEARRPMVIDGVRTALKNVA